MLSSLVGLATTNTVCDTVNPLPFEFEPERYMGIWYSITQSKGNFYIPVSDCVSALYSELDLVTGSFKVQNCSSEGFEPRSNLTGTASVADCPSGQIKVSFFGEEVDQPNYLILDTDYDTYAIVYGCDIEDAVPNLWFLAREPTLDEDLIAELTAKSTEMLPNYDWSVSVRDLQSD